MLYVWYTVGGTDTWENVDASSVVVKDGFLVFTRGNVAYGIKADTIKMFRLEV